MDDPQRGLELDETVEKMAEIAIDEANRWQRGGLSYTEARTCLLILTQQVCVEIVAAMATEMRDPIEFARTLETTFMNGFAEKVVARAAKFKTEK